MVEPSNLVRCGTPKLYMSLREQSKPVRCELAADEAIRHCAIFLHNSSNGDLIMEVFGARIAYSNFNGTFTRREEQLTRNDGAWLWDCRNGREHSGIAELENR